MFEMACNAVEGSDGGASLKGRLILPTLDGRRLLRRERGRTCARSRAGLVAGGGVGVGYGVINVPFPFCSLGGT